MTMTKEQYLTLRKSGKKRNDVQKDHFGNDPIAFRSFLSMIGLLSLETELIAMRDFQPTKVIKPKETLPFEPTKQEVDEEMHEASKRGRKLEHVHVTKEFIEAAFTAGKSAGQIEREEGMQQGTIYGRIKKWGIVNPNTKVASVQEKAEAVAEEVESVQEAEDTVIKQDEKVIQEQIETASKVSWRTFDTTLAKDLVNHPEHYTTGGIEVIDYLRAKLTDEEFSGFCKGNIIKYLSREKHKGGIESLRKAQWYLNRLVDEG